MTTTILLAMCLGAGWGLVWALCLQTVPGHFLAARFTWLTVVIGVGVDMFIALLIMPVETWLAMMSILGASSVAIIGRSLFNELRDAQEMIRMQREHSYETRQQDDLGD
jgi:ABC-type Na+ efflux pump permease subunit